MQHKITTSADGSTTLQLTRFNEAYHSTNGAYTEAMHIYIQNGLEYLFKSLFREQISNTPQQHRTNCAAEHLHIRIFDMGFGTGLNCILAYIWQQQLRSTGLPYPKISYYGIEKYPLPPDEIEQLNYTTIIAQHLDFPPDNLAGIFHFMHRAPWEEVIAIPPFEGASTYCNHTGEGEFLLYKHHTDITSIQGEYYRETPPENSAAIVFYDTFSPATQPELWDESIFREIASGSPQGTILMTYCSKGTVKQALRNTGFEVSRLPGPPGKRHIIRALLK